MKDNQITTGQMYAIMLQGEAYHVKVEGGLREVRYKGKWIDYNAFIDALADEGKFGQLCELANTTFVLEPERAEAVANEAMGMI